MVWCRYWNRTRVDTGGRSGRALRVSVNWATLNLLIVPEDDETGMLIGYTYWVTPVFAIYGSEHAAIERAKRDAQRLAEPAWLAEQSDVLPQGRRSTS